MPTRSPTVRNFLAGIAVVLPVFVMLLVAWRVYGAVLGFTDWLLFLPNIIGIEGPAARFLATVIGTVVVIGGLIAIGIVARNRFGQLVIGVVDRLVERVPVLGPVYRSLQEARTAITERGDDQFDDVVLVELAEQTHALAFVVGRAKPDLRTAVNRDDLVAVFVPLSPNPTLGGHMLFVPAERLVGTPLGVREALVAVLTIGAGEQSQRVDEPPIRGIYQRPDSSTSTEDSS